MPLEKMTFASTSYTKTDCHGLWHKGFFYSAFWAEIPEILIRVVELTSLHFFYAPCKETQDRVH